MNDRTHRGTLLPDDPQFEAHLREQRRTVLLKIQRHQWRHKWVTRTFITLFLALSAGAYVVGLITAAAQVRWSVILFLLLGAILMFHSRLHHVELQLEEIRTILTDATARPEASGPFS